MSAVEREMEHGRWVSRGSAALAWGSAAGAAAPQPTGRQEEERVRSRPRPAAAPSRDIRRELGAIVLAAMVGAACAGASAAVVREDLAVRAAAAAVAQLQTANRELALEYAQLGSPQVIQQEATERLGMHRPAGYVPVPVERVPPAPLAAPARTVEALLPLPSGPAPGGAAAMEQRGARLVARLWQGLRGVLPHPAGVRPRG